MNCWKSINLNKEYGAQWLKYTSFLISLLAFITLFVPFSIIHEGKIANDFGIVYLIIALVLLPALHAFCHMVPLLILGKRAKIICQRNRNWTPVITYSTEAHLTKTTSLVVAIAPTLLITLPGILATWFISDYYVFTLLFTSLHIGMTFVDFLYIHHIVKAPKEAFIESGHDGFDILTKEIS